MRIWISRQQARAFGPLVYRKAKRGFLMLAHYHGKLFWCGHVIPHGFYLTPYQG